MLCSRCGFDNKDENKYCCNCGNFLYKTQTTLSKLKNIFDNEMNKNNIYMLQYIELKKENTKLLEKNQNLIEGYNQLHQKTTKELENLKNKLTFETDNNLKLSRELKNIKEIKCDTEQLKQEVKELIKEKEDLQLEINNLNSNTLIATYDFSEYENLVSEDCKNKLLLLKNDEKELIRLNTAVINNFENQNKVNNNNVKQLLRVFNSECDNILLNLTEKNIDNSRNKINKSYESLNKIFETDNIAISKELLAIKLEELNLLVTYEIQKQNELEQQKAIKQQLLEEQKVMREIEQEKLKIEKEEKQFKAEVDKLMKYLNKSNNDIEKQLYIDKIKELEEKLKLVEKDKENILNREQNTRAGFVYIISNVGSFGENIYKIGMTRRLEPLDRIKELSDASVPFPFDVHALIFSDDAPTLENILHQTFKENQVNKINNKKEFYNVDLEKIKEVVKNNYNNTVDFISIPNAVEYRETLKIK